MPPSLLASTRRRPRTSAELDAWLARVARVALSPGSFVWTTDNGAPPNAGGSNFPLRGGKGSLWDGGYRVPGFINGGVLPASRRGLSLAEPIHVSDWWPTFAVLAGLAPADETGPTPLDGRDQGGYIFGSAVHTNRSEVVLDHLMHCVAPGDTSQCVSGQTPDFPAGHYPSHTTGALISGKVGGSGLWKLIVGPAQSATWYGKFSPNTTAKPPPYDTWVACWPDPCLFRLDTDPTENFDKSADEPDVLKAMLARFKALESGYHPPKANPDNNEAGLCAAIERARGFVAPWAGH